MVTMNLQGASSIYTFQGVIQSSASYNNLYPVSSLHAILGSTNVLYAFEIDFGREVSSFSNSAGTWNYFYVRLLGDGYMQQEIGSRSPEEFRGFNVFYNSGNDLGQISGGNTVRISKNGTDWMVQDWAIGQSFRFQDGVAAPRTGSPGSAVYYYGTVELVSIVAVPEASSTMLLGLALCPLILRRSRTKTIKQDGGGQPATRPESK